MQLTAVMPNQAEQQQQRQTDVDKTNNLTPAAVYAGVLLWT